MDGNKDEALRCLGIAEDAVASGDKGRALKFIHLAKRLYPSLSADDLVAACNKLDPVSINSSLEGIPESVGGDKLEPDKVDEKSENAELIRRLRRSDDYYAILGVKKSCSDEEIRKAYRKLSLKVHPDKNKAPGSEEAFKKVSRAFTCLSDVNSRKQYDQVGLVDEFDHIKRRYRRPRRRRKNTQTDFFADDFDPDEIFREFFGQGDTFRASHGYRNRRTRHQPPQEEDGPSFLTLLQILPFLLLFLLAYLPFSEPDYALHKNQSYQIPKTTQNHGIDFYVRSSAFDEKFPLGSSARFNIEDSVIKDYRNFLFHSCRVELQKRRWNKKLPTPHCNELQGYKAEKEA
ncbi:PREDICTED: chaperone protein dnaJ 49 isoform X2 [Tarenaya hassleriana]|uniref:chaperone protein dnaJ 49 isoform X2 n=1 Tax=Tarenaya hassleriana TaxID=28532 RepID=UPI00053C8ECD|nr:PREDICTED: chaperone protein dnaJ 49 isoform X2 [Tarenaya hassleriana]